MGLYCKCDVWGCTVNVVWGYCKCDVWGCTVNVMWGRNSVVWGGGVKIMVCGGVLCMLRERMEVKSGVVGV